MENRLGKTVSAFFVRLFVYLTYKLFKFKRQTETSAAVRFSD